MLARLASALTLSLALAMSASAQQPAPRGMGACRPDAARLCAGIEAGSGRRATCLRQNLDKLSPDCRTVIDGQGRSGQAQAPVVPAPAPAPQAMPPAAEAQAKSQLPSAPPAATAPAAGAAKANNRPLAACRLDLPTFCADIVAGGGKRLACLKANTAQLSPACAAALQEQQDVRADARFACRADGQRLCPGLAGAERRACLAANKASLSTDCAGTIGGDAGAPKSKPN